MQAPLCLMKWTARPRPTAERLTFGHRAGIAPDVGEGLAGGGAQGVAALQDAVLVAAAVEVRQEGRAAPPAAKGIGVECQGVQEAQLAADDPSIVFCPGLAADSPPAAVVVHLHIPLVSAVPAHQPQSALLG